MDRIKSPMRSASGSTRERGDRGEVVAASHLQGEGWEIVDRNVTYRCGELDVVADDGEQLVFVEVRTRYRANGPRAEDTVTHRKQRRLGKAARLYLSSYRGPRASARFDVIAVCGREGRVVAHYRGAFEAPAGES